MAHIVCITSGLRGLLNASFELVTRLQRAGHAVTYACPLDVSEDIRAQGIHYYQLPPVNYSPAPRPEPAGNDFLGIRSRLRQWLTAPRRRREGLEALGMSEFRTFLQASGPDIVIIDSELYEHILTIHDAGYAIALITPFFATWKAPRLPPLQTDVIPGEGIRGSRAGLEAVWFWSRCQRWLQISGISLRHAFTERRAVIRAYARQVGYPLRSLQQYSWVTLFNDSRLPVLSLTAEELEFPHKPRSGVHYVGPMVASTRSETQVREIDIRRLENIYEEKATTGRPLIYCWLTTMDDQDTEFLGRVITAVASRREWLLVLGHSGGDAGQSPDLPAHIHRFDYVPQIDVLNHADLCITQGGVNTINECLTCGVPMLVYATDRFDKQGCAARVAYHGLGIRADINRDDATAIARNIERALLDQSIRTRILAMRERLERYREQRIAETVIETLLKKSTGDEDGNQDSDAPHVAR